MNEKEIIEDGKVKRRARRRRFPSVLPLAKFKPPIIKVKPEIVSPKFQPYYSFEVYGRGIQIKMVLKSEDDFKVLDAILTKLKNEIESIEHNTLSPESHQKSAG